MLYKAMKNFLFLVALFPVTAAAFDPAIDSSDPYERELARRRAANGGFYPFHDPMDDIRDRQRRSAIYDVWETDSQGHYRQYLVIPDEYGRPSRITPGLSSGR
ncbi:hypothetical protein [Methylococcus capsulatus]|uniref:hypothetical protein n=1 Tax=Methylococcus capsulatus TaxID=414 RepID=UPI001C52E8B0|nr:hypothetical protein [Methylococcus capsulatus]QXP90456.1 hypothetical protein KW114_15755 [Methylococcus capsulatus]